ncbi:MAG: ATP-dependent helicase HrpB [Spirochaetales bacterium]|nr:ATP-dependent helicase HrpB [Spirochaetales bacterium]
MGGQREALAPDAARRAEWDMAARPSIQPSSLPIAPRVGDIARALEAGHLVLSAETGSGKTTYLPAALLEAMVGSGAILVLEPRRLAAVSAAVRASWLLGQKPGDSVGYRVRGATTAGPSTRLWYLTYAVFLRMVQDDPFLDGVRLVIFDEFHERSAVGDLCLAYALEAAGARDGLSIMLTSATLADPRLSLWLGASTMDVPGRTYPVDLAYLPSKDRPVAAVADGVDLALSRTSGDVLAFLPGARELAECASLVRARHTDVDALVLHGSLPLEAQRLVIDPPPAAPRRVVLATSVAETSVTVPRVGAVVDSGLSRLSLYDARLGMNRLSTLRSSDAEAEQRRGRAGRLGPGLCVRCWDRSDKLAPAREPEILRTELAGIALECAVRGAVRPADTRWLDAPPPAAWAAGLDLIRELGFVGTDCGATERGRAAAGLGADPRAAASVLSAVEADPGGPDAHAACLLAALGTERDAADFGQSQALDERVRFALDGGGGQRGAAILAEARRLYRRATGGQWSEAAARAAASEPGRLLAPGYPDRLARPRPDGFWEFRSGRQARPGPGLPVSGWVVAVDVDAGDRQGRIHRAAPVDDAVALAVLSKSAVQETVTEWKGLEARRVRRSRSGVFTLAETRLPRPSGGDLARAVADRLAAEGVDWLPWCGQAEAMLTRIRYASRHGAFEAPAWLDDARALATVLAESLPPWLSDSGPALDSQGLAQAVRYALDLDQPCLMATLDRVAPATLVTPGGRRRTIPYPEEGDARLSLRIQEVFGMESSPLVCGRPLVLELLSPADRPVQATSDLAGFWRNTYPRLRQELSRRYPKHHWPDDPLAAVPGKGLKPKMSP